MCFRSTVYYTIQQVTIEAIGYAKNLDPPLCGFLRHVLNGAEAISKTNHGLVYAEVLEWSIKRRKLQNQLGQ